MSLRLCPLDEQEASHTIDEHHAWHVKQRLPAGSCFGYQTGHAHILVFTCAMDIRGYGVICCIFYRDCILIMHWIATVLGSSTKAASMALLICGTIAFIRNPLLLPEYKGISSMQY
jgi:hypothetical protein